MPIKLNGATNGSVELDVPAAVGSDLQITLPATAGTAIVKAADGSVDLGSVDIDSSGNLGIATSSPSQRLTVGAGSGPEAIVIQSGSGNTGELRFTDTGSSGYQGAVVYNHPSSFMEFMVNSSSRMKIDSSGRVGIGIAPSSSPLEVLSGTSNSSLIEATGASAGRGLKISTYANTANDAGVLIEAPYSTYGQLAFGTAGSERVRITSAGLVGIGDSAPDTNLVVKGTNKSLTNSVGNINVISTDTAAVDTGGSIGLGGFYNGTSNSIPFANLHGKKENGTGNNADGYFAISTRGTSGTVERFKIDSSGKTALLGTSTNGALVVETTQSAATNKNLIVGGHSASSIDGGTGCFVVLSNGNVVNTNNSYGALSDVKLKENIVNASSQWDDLKAIQIRNYNLKESTGQQTHTQLGVVAQEVELVSPGLVSESPDLDADGNDLGTVTKSVNYSVLYMKAVKALQEAIAKIETLEARVTTLEAG